MDPGKERMAEVLDFGGQIKEVLKASHRSQHQQGSLNLRTIIWIILGSRHPKAILNLRLIPGGHHRSQPEIAKIHRAQDRSREPCKTGGSISEVWIFARKGRQKCSTLEDRSKKFEWLLG
jgi:hypothetical protein